MNGVARAGVAGFIALGAALSIGTAREIRTGAQAMRESDAALARHDTHGAMLAARDAAEACAPGSPYVRAGFARLESLARDAEARRDERSAISAWSAMRAAAASTRGPFVSTDSFRALAEDGIARDGSRADAASAEVHATEPLIRASLARDEGPSSLSLALLAMGGLGFFAGAFRLAFAARDLASLRRERLATLVTAAGLALYILACLRA